MADLVATESLSLLSAAGFDLKNCIASVIEVLLDGSPFLPRWSLLGIVQRVTVPLAANRQVSRPARCPIRPLTKCPMHARRS